MMKKLNIIFTIGILFSVMFICFVSCEKNTNSNDSNKSGDSTKSDKILDYSTLNPFEYVGIQHNACLESLGEDENFGEMTLEEEMQFMLDWFYNEDGVYPDVTASELGSDFETGYLDDLDFNDSINSLYNNGDITLTQKNVLSSIVEAIEGAFSNNESFNESCSEIENDIYGLEISNSDKELLWGAIAVAKHSGNFWYEAINDEDNPFYFTCDCPLHSGGGGKAAQNPSCIGHALADAWGWTSTFVTTLSFREAKAHAPSVSRKYDHRNDNYGE